jgi:hypothetical protein
MSPGLPESAVPEPVVRELQALYREAANEEPGPALDRRILDAAHAEVQAVPPARPPRPWWRGWLPVASALAVATVGLSLAWRVIDQQERELREEMNAAAADARARKSAPAQLPATAGPPADAPAPARVRGAAAEAARDAASDLAQPAARQAPLPAAPAPAAEAATGAQGPDPDQLRERRDARPEAKAAAGTAARAAAEAVGDAASPQAWLQQIRDLRAAGRGAEAEQSLARFRARYPDFALPEDLQNPRGH